MRIKQFTYRNKEQGWQINPVRFADTDLTLLVGVSGAGKTQLLEALWLLKMISVGHSIAGAEWDITFSTHDDVTYRWEGAFAESNSEPTFVKEFYAITEADRPKTPIRFEKLCQEGVPTPIIERNESLILFGTVATPKLFPAASAIELLREEEQITPVYKAFERIFRDKTATLTTMVESYPAHVTKVVSSSTNFLPKVYKNKINVHLDLELAWAYQHNQEKFSRIKDSFINLFPQVEAVKIEPRLINFGNLPVSTFPITIKEKYSGWLHQSQLSAGMLKALTFISQVYLLPRGSVMLIDEFENSLGVNCIDVLEELPYQKSGIQFIITSHHPYIISHIPINHWKIVTRKGGDITVHEAAEFERLSNRSLHDNFTRLLNTKAYTQGIAA